MTGRLPRAAAGLAALAVAAGACGRPSRAEREAAAMTGGDPRRGAALVRAQGCGSCHTVPGVPGAVGIVGPPLAGVAARAYVAGRLANTPENLIRWIRAPHAVDPQTAMPDLGIDERDARDVAAFLETLR